jgi:hypothetical protein
MGVMFFFLPEREVGFSSSLRGRTEEGDMKKHFLNYYPLSDSRQRGHSSKYQGLFSIKKRRVFKSGSLSNGQKTFD